jgi:VanZ family protein
MLRISFYLFFVLVTYLSLRLPSDELHIEVNDKFGHALAYLVLMINGGLVFGKKKYVILSVGLFLFGSLIEVLQRFVPGRTSSFLDLLANSSGIVLGLSILLIFGTYIQSKLKQIGLSK